ncbi:MAG TPA: hypothetical protein VGX23_04875 [Actinocrinis sp.]|nr:hypothetical protein [Actinocrinis sp.]
MTDQGYGRADGSGEEQGTDSGDAIQDTEPSGGAENLEGADEIESAAAEPRRWLDSKVRRRVALGLVAVLAVWAGGWYRAWSDRGLTGAQADQASVRLTLDNVSLGQSNGCDNLGGTQTVLQIPLHNYSPGPVQLRSIAVDPPGQAPGAPQKMGFTLPPGGTTTVEVLIPIQLCTAHQSAQCQGGEVELDATAVVVPESGRVHDVRLPIGEWVPFRFLQLFEDAPFANWAFTSACAQTPVSPVPATAPAGPAAGP